MCIKLSLIHLKNNKDVKKEIIKNFMNFIKYQEID